MRLLNCKLEFCDFDDDKAPAYAILSHTWHERNENEISYQDLREGTTKSLRKLELCRDWTVAAKLEYFWVDTCCIDKRNDAEISYAIRSMWRWYHDADVCFVYLSDLSLKRKRDSDMDWRDALRGCRWFTRGWTLQELVAPRRVEFYAQDGDHLSSKEDLLPELRAITGINLNNSLPAHASRLDWVTRRQTKRPEDKAYCMLGICEVSLDPRYGEGAESAWRRLQEAITHRHGTIALQVQDARNNSDHRETILDALRFHTLETRRNTVKVASAKTGKWILSHPACAKWLEQEHKFFWIKGKPGAGKSVLIKYLDSHVTKKLKKTNAIGLYFYFNARGEQLEKSFLGLYRSLLVQLVDAVPELAHELDALDLQFDLPQLQRVLSSAISGLGKQIWLFIDALDECREGDIRDLIDFLTDLEDAELSVCFASRHYPVVKIPTQLQLVLEELPEHKQDLRTYVERLDLDGEELVQIQDDIVAKANGIFLWVVLVVRILEKDVNGGRFHAIQSRLQQIPEGLPDLFKTIVFRDDEHKDEFVLCIRWILYALRPLSLDEWYFAMLAGIDRRIERTSSDINQRMETFLRSSSKGLAELTKGKTITVQFIHESVRDFLVHEGGVVQICGEDEALESTAHEQLRRCCLRGIEFEMPRELVYAKNKKELLTANERLSLISRYPFAEYATSFVWHHADQAVRSDSQQLSLPTQADIWTWMRRYNVLQKKKPDVYYTEPSFDYLCAERDLTRLILQPHSLLSPEPKQRYKSPLVAAVLKASWMVLRMFLERTNANHVDEIMGEIRSRTKFEFAPYVQEIPWCWTIRNGLEHLSKHLLTFVSEQEFATHLEKSTVLGLAIRAGNKDLFEHLVSSRQLDVRAEYIMETLPPSRLPPLVYAVQRNKGEIIECCLLHYTDSFARDNILGVALIEAATHGHKTVLQSLLAASADVKAQEGPYLMDALQAASYYGHTEEVSMLLAAGADVNAQGGPRGNALQAASECGREAVVLILLAAGADVNAQGGTYGNALQAAACEGKEKVVSMLLHAGADVNAEGGRYGNALRAAASEGNETVVSMLLAAGADVNAKGGEYATALQAASYWRRNRSDEVVSMLLAAGAEINAQGGRFGNALQAASAATRNREVVSQLLAAGATVNAYVPESEYGNALQAALGQLEFLRRFDSESQYNNDEETTIQTIQLLLDAGADVNAPGGKVRTYGNALEAARHMQLGERVIQMLIEHGARSCSEAPNQDQVKT